MAKQSPILAPRRLFVQILGMQAVYFAIGFGLITFDLLVSGHAWHVKYLLSWEFVRFDNTFGWTLALLWLLDTFFSVLAMALIVGRSKLALDFALTLHGINLAVVWLYTGKFPRNWFWWAVQAVSAALMVSLGIWVTQWRELRRAFFEDFEMVDLNRDGSAQV